MTQEPVDYIVSFAMDYRRECGSLQKQMGLKQSAMSMTSTEGRSDCVYRVGRSDWYMERQYEIGRDETTIAYSTNCIFTPDVMAMLRGA